MLRNPLNNPLELENLESIADEYIIDFEQRVKPTSFRGFGRAAKRWTNSRKNRNMTAWLNVKKKFLAGHEFLTQNKIELGSKGNNSITLPPTTIESGTKRAEKIPVHYECLVLAKAHEMLMDVDNNETVYGYIGVSKLCCLFCSLFFQGYNELMKKRRIVVRGSHGRVYDKVCAPVLGERDKEMERVLIFRLNMEIADQLLAGPTILQGKGRTSSESSVEIIDSLGRLHEIDVDDNDEENTGSEDDN